MPHLVSDTGAMRLAIELVLRERAGAAPAGEARPDARLLATAAVEWFDQRDGEWWPFVRLPPLHLDVAVVEALVAGVRDVLQGAAPGFAWQSGEAALLGVQLGATDRGALVEVGLDLGPFLADVSGSATPAAAAPGGGELALFRFPAVSAEIVRFAGALEAQLRDLLA